MGNQNMQSLTKLISSWRKWINRNQTFQKKEMDEMEDHLIEEIDYLVQRENLSEEEAFHKATIDMGKRNELDQEFVKIKPLYGKVGYWSKIHTWNIIFALVVIILVLFSDLIYSSKNYIDSYEPTDKDYHYSSWTKNSYTAMIPVSDIKRESVSMEKNHITFPIDGIFYNINGEEFFSDKNKFNLPKGSKMSKMLSIDNAEIINPNIFWDSKTEFKIDTIPIYLCKAAIFESSYLFVLDDFNQLWLEKYPRFKTDSPRVKLKLQDYSQNKFLLDTRYRQFSQIYYSSLFPIQQENSSFMYFKSINLYKVLLFQKDNETGLVSTIRLQLIKLPNQECPILAWDEVNLVRKSIHIWDLLFQYLSKNNLKEVTNAKS